MIDGVIYVVMKFLKILNSGLSTPIVKSLSFQHVRFVLQQWRSQMADKEALKRALSFMIGLIGLIGAAAIWASHTAPPEWVRTWYGIALTCTSFAGILSIIVSLMD